MKKLVLILLFMVLFFNQALAAEKEEYLTRGEVAVMLSATDFIKNKIGELFNWAVGYDLSKINRMSLAPIIRKVSAIPVKTPPDGRTILRILASVDDPGGLGNLKGVRGDLSSIGRLPNMMFVDNGMWGDEISSDGTYTLETNVNPKVELGEKEVQIAAANKKGWLTLTRTTLIVEKNPSILETGVSPSEVLTDGVTPVKIYVKIDNPGRIEDVKVTVDLKNIGGESSLVLYNDGTHGDLVAGDKYFTITTTVKRGISAGAKKIPFVATNLMGGVVGGEIILKVK